MGMYVIMRTDQGGGYVTRPGSKSSYTKNLEKARIWDTREQAETDWCPENEIIIPIVSALGV